MTALGAPRGQRDVSRRAGGAQLHAELARLLPSMPVAAREWVLAHPEEATRRYVATVGAGKLYNRFGPTAAPRPGEKGYRAPAAPSPGRGMLAQAYQNLEDPMFFAGWSALTEAHDWTDDEEHDELIADFLDLYVGVPDRAMDGRVYTFEDRVYLALWVTDLAMLAHPTMHMGTSWDGGDVYLRHRPEGEPLPYWLAAALADDALQADGALRLVNVPIETACSYIAEHHSQLPDCNRRGLMYALGVMRGARLVAVGTAGHPSGRWGSRRVNVKNVLELTRVASDGTVKGAASKLVARLLDLLPVSGRAEGPELFVTYSLASEPGTPYRALADKGLRPVEFVPGKIAGGARKGSHGALHDVDKVRWEAGEAAMPARWDLLG